MATSHQYAQQSESLPPQEYGGQGQFVSDLIDLDFVSVSQLLGRDYIFIDAEAFSHSTGDNQTTYIQLEMLIRQLELAQNHTVVVTVKPITADKRSFARHDLTWYKGKICRIESTPITHQDQLEFMDMIWQCSTAAVPS